MQIKIIQSPRLDGVLESESQRQRERRESSGGIYIERVNDGVVEAARTSRRRSFRHGG